MIFTKQCRKITSRVFKTQISWSNSSLKYSNSWAGKQKLSTWNSHRTRVYHTRVPSLHFFFLICFCRVFLLYFSVLLLCFSILHSPPLFFNFVFSTPNLCSNRFAFFGSTFSNWDRSAFSRSFFFLWIWFFGSSYCLHLHLILQILLEFEKLEIHVDKLLHLSTRTRVFEAQFCHRTRASKTRDASFLHGFKTLLTNNILSQTYASLQITSSNQYGLKLNEWLR